MRMKRFEIKGVSRDRAIFEGRGQKSCPLNVVIITMKKCIKKKKMNHENTIKLLIKSEPH
jgi:hypothetical protein